MTWQEFLDKAEKKVNLDVKPQSGEAKQIDREKSYNFIHDTLIDWTIDRLRDLKKSK